MKTRGQKRPAVQAVLNFETRGRITFSPPVRKDEAPVQTGGGNQGMEEDAGNIGRRLRERRDEAPVQTGGGGDQGMEDDAGNIGRWLRERRDEAPVQTGGGGDRGMEEEAGNIGRRLRERKKAGSKDVEESSSQQPAGKAQGQPGKAQGHPGKAPQPAGKTKDGGGGRTKTARKRRLSPAEEDWGYSGSEGESDDSGWEEWSTPVAGGMPALRQVSFPPSPPGESEEEKMRREEQEEAERKKAWAEWQFAAATERNRIRGEHDRKAVQRNAMHRRWLRSLSKKERKKHLKASENKERMSALQAERTLVELHADLVSALWTGHTDVPRAVSVLEQLKDMVMTQRLLTDQPAIVYTLKQVRDFAGSRQVRKLADRLYLRCRVPFPVYEGEAFLQAFERSRQELLEKDARILQEKLARRTARALRREKAAGDQVVPGERLSPARKLSEQDMEAVVP